MATVNGGAGRDRAVVDRSGDSAPIAAFMLAPAQTGRVAGAVLTGIEDLTLLAGSGGDGLFGGAGDGHGPGRNRRRDLRAARRAAAADRLRRRPPTDRGASARPRPAGPDRR